LTPHYNLTIELKDELKGMNVPEHFKKRVKDKIEDYKTKGWIIRNAKEMMNLEIKDLEE